MVDQLPSYLFTKRNIYYYSRRIIRSDEVSTLSIAKPISRTGRSGGLQLLAALPIHGTGAPLSLGHRQRP